MPESSGVEALDVTVVVCTHTAERRPLLEGLIASIATGTRLPREIVVVVDRNPSLLEALRGLTWPLAVRLMPSDGSGLAAARNTGWRAATSSLIAFIDDDAIASPEWLSELAGAAEQTHAGVVGGRIDPIWSGGEPEWYTPLLGWVVGCSYEGLPTVPAKVRNVIGCNMLFRRDLLERLGGFDTTLGRMDGGLAGCEETELCIRANRSGASVVLIPDAPVAQVLPPARGSLAYAIRRGWHEGRSKRSLVRLHGRVLGTESRYASALVRQALTRLLRGILGRPAEIVRAVGLVAVLGATTLSYVLYAMPRATVVPARASRAG